MIKTVTLYEKNTGKIIASFQGTEDSIGSQETDLIGIIDGIYPLNMYVDENLNVISIPEKQFEYQVFDFATKEFVNDKAMIVLYRNSLLAQSDWTQLPDVPLATKQAWATYRQALRDITTQEGYPFSVIWPTKPE